MSQGTSCKCPESLKPLKERRWGVIDRRCNHSAFNGYRCTYSDYSQVICLECNSTWRTKAKYADDLRQVVIDIETSQWAFSKTL